MSGMSGTIPPPFAARRVLVVSGSTLLLAVFVNACSVFAGVPKSWPARMCRTLTGDTDGLYIVAVSALADRQPAHNLPAPHIFLLNQVEHRPLCLMTARPPSRTSRQPAPGT